MITLASLRSSVQSNVSYWNRLSYLVNHDDFLVAFKLATPKEKEDLLDGVGKKSTDYYKDFIQKQRITKFSPLENLNVRKLRRIAQSYKIAEYWLLNKASLVKEIERYEKHQKYAKTRVAATGSNSQLIKNP